MSAYPHVTCIIPSWQRRESLLRCLSTIRLQTYKNLMVIVVDNGSTDGTSEAVANLFPEVLVLRKPVNLGFAEGTNEGIRAASQRPTDFLFLVNNDAQVDFMAVETLVRAAKNYPNVGIFGSLLIESRPARRFFPYTLPRIYARYRQYRGTQSMNLEGTDIFGCGMFLRRSVVERVGMFDPAYFAYFEDRDLCRRARRAGIQTRLVRESKLLHETAASSGGFESDSRLRAYFIGRNQVRFWRTDPRMGGAGLLWRSGLQAALTASSILYRPNPLAAVAKLRGIWEGLRCDLAAWPLFPDFCREGSNLRGTKR